MVFEILEKNKTNPFKKMKRVYALLIFAIIIIVAIVLS